MEQEYGLIGGNIFHGELSLEQLFHMRPAPGYADYRTPIAGLYNGSSGTHAGGGVCGIPGWQAARAALADKKRGQAVPVSAGLDDERWTQHAEAAVAAMLGARSMAVVGASPRADSFGARMVIEAQRGSARVHLVNPRYDRIGELPCVPSLADLDEPVDLVLLGVPDAALTDQLAAAAAAGARSAVLFGSAHGLREQIAVDRRRRRHGGVRRGLHGLRQQRARRAGAGLPGARSVAAGASASSPIPARRSPRCCAPAGDSGSGSRCPRDRNSSPTPPTTSTTRSTIPDTAHHRAAAGDPARGRRGCGGRCVRAAEQDVPVVILTVGGSPRGRAMVAAHSGALAGERAAWQAFCAATGAVHVSDLAEFSDTTRTVLGRARGPSAGGIATVHDSGAERALVADLAHELGVEFADLAPDTLADHRRHARRRAGADQPARRLGHRRRHPQPVRRLPARDGRRPGGRGHRARRRPGHRVRRRHRLRRRGDRRRQAHRRADGGAGLGGVGDRPTDRGTTAGQRHSRAGRRPQRPGGAGRTWRAGRCRRRVEPADPRTAGSAGRRLPRSAFELLADYGVPVVPTSDRARLRTATRCGRRAGRLSRRHENRCRPAQERRRRRDARHLRDEARCGRRTRRWRGALGPCGDRRADGRRPASRCRSGIVRDRASARCWSSPRAAPWSSCSPTGWWPARRYRAVGARSRWTACGSGRCWPGGAVSPRSISTRSPTSSCAFSQMAIELGDVFDAVEANPVIVSRHGAVAVDVLAVARETLPASRHELAPKRVIACDFVSQRSEHRVDLAHRLVDVPGARPAQREHRDVTGADSTGFPPSGVTVMRPDST